MTPLDIYGYNITAVCNGKSYRTLGRRAMTPAIGVDLSEHLAYSTLKGAANRSLGYQILLPMYLLIPGAGDEINLEHIT